MKAGAPDEVLTGSPGWRCVVSSWLGPRMLAKELPVQRGRVTASASQQIPESLTLSVPRWDGLDWRPDKDPLHPLARYGQQLQVSIIVTSAVTGQEWETRLGRFLIVDWDDDDEGRVAVSAVGLLRRVEDDRLTTPLQPRPGGTLVSEARRLLPAGMSAGFSPLLVDRACPAGMSWPENRLEALREIAAAWPARLRTDEWGQVQFLPPLPEVPAPVITVTDGPRGLLQKAPRSDTRDGAFNRIVARSSATNGPDVQGIAEQTSGPMAVTGPYGPVTKIWSSPLIETVAQANASAQTMLRNNLLPTQTIPVVCAPDPRIDLDDAINVVRDAGTERKSSTWGWVTGYDIPLTVGDGAMRVDVGVAA